KDTLKDSGAGVDKSVEELQTDQDDGDDEDAGDQEIDQPPDLTDYQLVRDREPKTRTKPLRFRDESNMAAYAFAAAEEEDTHEPLTYQEAVACEDSSKWKAAMKEEMGSLRKNKTWELVDHQAGQKLVTCKWLFKIKEGIEGVQKPRYKARLVARGFTERAGIDYNESKAEIGSTKSLLKREFDMKDLGEAKKILDNGKSVQMSLGGHFKLSLKDYPIRDCDVEKISKVTYANAVGSLMYLMVCTSPDIAYAVSIVSRYLANPGKNHWEAVKWILKYLRGVRHEGSQETKKILGMEIVRDQSRKILRVSQSRYVSKILNNVRIDNGKSVQMPLGGHFKLSLKDCPVRDCDVERMSKVPYANAVGSLMYLMVCMRPDIAYAGAITYREIIEVFEAKTVEVLKMGTEHNAADALTKVVPGHKLQHCLELLTVIEFYLDSTTFSRHRVLVGFYYLSSSL
nr:hypothetical protein [Tanacetum cinerariifolium]